MPGRQRQKIARAQAVAGARAFFLWKSEVQQQRAEVQVRGKGEPQQVG